MLVARFRSNRCRERSSFAYFAGIGAACVHVPKWQINPHAAHFAHTYVSKASTTVLTAAVQVVLTDQLFFEAENVQHGSCNIKCLCDGFDTSIFSCYRSHLNKSFSRNCDDMTKRLNWKSVQDDVSRLYNGGMPLPKVKKMMQLQRGFVASYAK